MTYELPETYCSDCVKKMQAERDQNEKKPNKIMKKTNKSKNEIIVVPTTAKKVIKKTKTTKLRAPRTPASKSSTCAYYDCLIDQVSSPENDHVKITQLTHKCKCSKEELAKTKAEIKHQLVHELARDYKSIGENLGKYVKADIVGCVKELGNK